jgi:hypothetical protein
VHPPISAPHTDSTTKNTIWEENIPNAKYESRRSRETLVGAYSEMVLKLRDDLSKCFMFAIFNVIFAYGNIYPFTAWSFAILGHIYWVPV